MVKGAPRPQRPRVMWSHGCGRPEQTEPRGQSVGWWRLGAGVGSWGEAGPGGAQSKGDAFLFEPTKTFENGLILTCGVTRFYDMPKATELYTLHG